MSNRIRQSVGLDRAVTRARGGPRPTPRPGDNILTHEINLAILDAAIGYSQGKSWHDIDQVIESYARASRLWSPYLDVELLSLADRISETKDQAVSVAPAWTAEGCSFENISRMADLMSSLCPANTRLT